jgi:CRISPR system Cascade subunit CasA
LPFNLIEQPWIPLRRAGGEIEWRPPWAITDPGPGGDDPYVAVAAARPDLSGALVQFLIGLVQTTAPPADDRDWRRWWKEPPTPEELRERFTQAAHAFNLDGPGPRFLQEKLPPKADCWPPHLLLPDQPEPTKEDDNKDHFIKRGQVPGLCRACAAAALLALQTNAPAGGRGHLTGLRGGGPLTTLVLGHDLWQTIWLAVLPRDRFWSRGKAAGLDSPLVFPWLFSPQPKPKEDPTRITPLAADPAHCFWGQPRRVWLDLEGGLTQGTCPLCGRENETLASGYFTRPNGIKYEGGWRHPLSPTGKNAQGETYSLHGQPGGVSYRHWLGLVLADQDKSTQPAPVIWEFFQHRRPAYAELLAQVSARGGGQPQLWVFGFDMDNKKARGWVESLMPLVVVAPEYETGFALAVTGLVKTAEQAAYSLGSALKTAWFPNGVKVKVNQGDLGRISQLLWETTEADFYAALDRLKELLEAGHAWSDDGEEPDSEMVAFKEGWLKTLGQAAQTLFHDYSQETQIGQVQDPKRIARAGLGLRFFVSTRQDQMRGLMALPLLERKKPKPPRGKKRGGDK